MTQSDKVTNKSKPILPNGFELKNGLIVKTRLEKVFFTEIYELSDGRYLYLFTNLNEHEIIDKGTKYEIQKIEFGSKEYLGIISETHSNENITSIVEDLTTLRGFEAVAGMRELKSLLINEVINPLQNPEKFEKFKLSIPNGILLYGPPGCGKTFIIRKLAEELQYTFIEVKHSDVASPYIHGSVGKIGKVFEMAKLKAPSIIFIDEIEGLVPKRESMGGESQHKQEEVNEFLMQLNEAGGSRVLVIGATNRPHLIDTAILRSGRMDKRIFVPPPDLEARKELFKIYLSGRPHSEKIDYEKLGKETEFFVGSDIELIVTETARTAVAEDKIEINEPMLMKEIKKFNPSISLQELEYYQNFTSLERT